MKRVDDTVETVQELGRDIGAYIREQRNHAEISLRQLAKLAGVPNPYLSQIERGLRKPSAGILQQIAKGLRISAEALYVQAGMLDERAGGPIVDAVVADASLSERQKQVLIDVYESFRRENLARQPANTAAESSTVQSSIGDGSRVDGSAIVIETPTTKE